MEQPSYVLNVFEGPLDLLLHLIQKNQVSIYDIPILEISNQYLEYLEKMREFDLEVTSEFVVMAAQLLYIKSRMLLPKPEALEEQEDPRAELVEKLLEYQKYQVASRYLEEREHVGDAMFYKKPDKVEGGEIINSFDHVTVYDLFDMVKELLQNYREEQRPPQESFTRIVGREKVSVRSQVEAILAVLRQQNRCDFLTLFQGLPSRAHVVARFLGVLELMRRNRIDVKGKKGQAYFCLL